MLGFPGHGRKMCCSPFGSVLRFIGWHDIACGKWGCQGLSDRSMRSVNKLKFNSRLPILLLILPLIFIN